MIMAHKNFEFLHHLIEYFTHDCYVFVHIDKKSSITREEEACLRAMPQVSGVYRKYSVHWGGFSILKCEIFLMKEALLSCDADYFHLISGQDYPIKPLCYFLQFFEENKGKEYIRSAHVPNSRWDKYSYKRFQNFYLLDFFKDKDSKSLRWINAFVSFQKKLGFKRRIPDYFEFLYGSTQWFSITRRAVETLLNYTRRHPAFYRRCRFTFAPEEYYIATVLGNILPAKDIAQKDLRFIRWRQENGNYPANLGMEHFHLLTTDEKSLFARKIIPEVSGKLIPLIDHYLLTDREVERGECGSWIYDGYRKYEYSEKYAHLIADLCSYLELRSVLDIGCGAGLYVAALRRRGIAASGFDANPHTAKLSSLLLPFGDEPCQVGDVTEEIETDEPFDLVMCMDFLSELPKQDFAHACMKIGYLAGKYLLISEKAKETDICHYKDVFHQHGFLVSDFGTAFFNKNCRRLNNETETILFKRLSNN